MLLRLVPRASSRPLAPQMLQRALATKPPPGAVPTDGATPKFGKKVSDVEESAAQLTTDIGRGRYEYLGDFVASMNKGPVKVDFSKEQKPVSEKQKKIDELNERNLKMIQRSLVIGTALAGFSCFIGWQFTKWYYGVKDVNGFIEVMNERMPKVSGKLEDSAVGRQLQALSEESRDAIADSERITGWRRGIREKFNTPEGAAIARQNSMVMAERREAERAMRKSTRKPVTSSTGTETTEGGSPEGREYREHAALAAAAMADAKAEEEAEKKPGAKLQRRLSQAFEGAVEGTYQTLVGRKEEASSSAGGKPAELPQRSLSATAQEIIRSVRGTQAAAAADDTQSSPANTDAAAAQRAKPADEPPPLQRSLSARVLESARGLVVGSKPSPTDGEASKPAAAS